MNLSKMIRRLYAGVFLVGSLILTPMSASAVPIASGGVYDLLSQDVFSFEFATSSTGGQDFDFEFSIAPAEAPQPASVVSLIITGFTGTLANPSLVWADSDLTYSSPGYSGGIIYETAVFTSLPGGLSTTLATVFDGAKLSQVLNFGWQGFSGGDLLVSLQVQAVPVPPAALLFGTALLGIGFLSRRRRKKNIASKHLA